MNFYHIFESEKQTLKKLGYILFESKENTYLYHIQTGTLKKITDQYFIQLRDFTLFYSDKKEFVKSFSIENSNVDLLYRDDNANKTLDVTIHLTLTSTMELSINQKQFSLDFYSGDKFQFADLRLNPIKKEYDFYFEDNMKKSVIFYGRNNVYYYSSWNHLDSISDFFENEYSFLTALLEILNSPTLKQYYQMHFEIIQRYIPGIISIIKDYSILGSQKELLENIEEPIIQKKYVLKNIKK